MRAVEITDFGGPENLKLVDRPDPTAEPGHAVLAVAAAGAGLFDVLIRQGAKPDVGTGFVPGLEVAGTVVEVGSDDDARVGGTPGLRADRTRRRLQRPRCGARRISRRTTGGRLVP